jgi:precorrin-8X/cobalt-precorrin-8 methylmutase
MELQIQDIQNLQIIDSEIANDRYSPAEYEILRRTIYATADFDYQSSLCFSPTALSAGATALAARTTIVVDVPIVRAGILPQLERTFVNPVYCGEETPTRPQQGKTQAAWGIETLAKRYREAIFIIGQDLTALPSLLESIESEKIQPALLIATASSWNETETIQQKLQNLAIPNIRIEGRKGNPLVAVAILNALVDLAWQAYGQ